MREKEKRKKASNRNNSDKDVIQISRTSSSHVFEKSFRNFSEEALRIHEKMYEGEKAESLQTQQRRDVLEQWLLRRLSDRHAMSCSANELKYANRLTRCSGRS